MTNIRVKNGIITTSGSYKPGDQAPEGYLEWHAWAEVQHKSGLRQKECGECGLWRYPQEMSSAVVEYTARKRDGKKIVIREPLCLDCNQRRSQASALGL